MARVLVCRTAGPEGRRSETEGRHLESQKVGDEVSWLALVEDSGKRGTESQVNDYQPGSLRPQEGHW